MIVRSVAVLGAGTMGAQIAAHFANAGVPALLLDVSADAARRGLQRAQSLRPDPFFTPETAQLVTTGAFGADVRRVADADWIVEAIVEELEAKRTLLAQVDAVRRKGSVVSSNTSGLSIAELGAGRSHDFRAHWLGTHFFNPPRYLRLLEVVPTPDTSADIVSAVTRFADRRLGKGVVIVKDSPGFIGNHIGMHGLLRMLEKVDSGEYSIEEVDAITGPPIGRPKSATFRTLDLTGLDVVAQVVDDLRRRLPAPAGQPFRLPAFVERMIARGITGEKAGGGFYRRIARPDGESDVLVIDPQTLEYGPRRTVELDALDATRSLTDAADRVRVLFRGADRVGDFLRATMGSTLRYTFRVASEVAHSADDVDRVMRWGFGWELGPFELADAIGIEGLPRAREGPLPPAGPGLQLLGVARRQGRYIRGNPAASLVDLGDGVLGVEFHSKLNVIGADTVQVLQEGLREAEAGFAALVIGCEAQHFSAGADLKLLLAEARNGNWAVIDQMIRTFQATTAAVRTAGVPVVVAAAGLTLGGGCELALHADRVQAAAESYLGLVETSVGLIPGGGGTKEMLARAVEGMAPGASGLLPAVQRVFETLAYARTSTSALDARRVGYLRPVDQITANRERLIAAAKATALRLVEDGYQPPVVRQAIPVGGQTVLATLNLGVHLAWRAGRISDHDALIGRSLAAIMAGGVRSHVTTISEQHLLDLERETFLTLIGEPKTQSRMQHTLETGKPLRN